MGKNRLFLSIILILALFFGAEITGVNAYEGPVSKKKMATYSDVVYSMKNFSKVMRGMTQEEVLQLLGVPEKIKEEKRKHDRWTVHYFYPDGHVVNFKNGLVVGKK